jgi:hypothetical protein
MASLTTAMSGLAIEEPPAKLQFTPEEIQCFKDVTVKLALSKEKGGGGYTPSQIRPREVAIISMLSKCRVDKTIVKYIQFMDVLKQYDLTLDSLYENMDSLKAKGIVDKFNTNYQVCGRDNGGRSIMWIGASKPSQISEEQIVVHSGILYWMAVHSDLHTLREGCTFVIDTSKQKGVNKVGNEKKLQKTWQALPLRPQNLFIVGAGFFKRIFINTLIAFASLFSNSKVLARIRFVEMPEVRTEVPDESMPEELGGQKRPSVDEWVVQRLAIFNQFTFDAKGAGETKDDVTF